MHGRGCSPSVSRATSVPRQPASKYRQLESAPGGRVGRSRLAGTCGPQRAIKPRPRGCLSRLLGRRGSDASVMRVCGRCATWRGAGGRQRHEATAFDARHGVAWPLPRVASRDPVSGARARLRRYAGLARSLDRPDRRRARARPGGGPSTREAVNRGARDARGRSISCNIALPVDFLHSPLEWTGLIDPRRLTASSSPTRRLRP